MTALRNPLSGATFSGDRRYRYRLTRVWGAAWHRCVFVGLNPSDAGEVDDDPTIRKECGFARRWGFGALDKVNLFGLISARPERLRIEAGLAGGDPVGRENDAHLRQAIAGARRVVFAWGSHSPPIRALVKARLDELGWIGRLAPGCEVGTLGRNKDGTPRHPVRIAYCTEFVPQ